MHRKIKLFVNDDISLDLNLDDNILKARGITEERLRNVFATTFRIFFQDFLDIEKHCGVVVVDKEGKVMQYFYSLEEDKGNDWNGCWSNIGF